MAIAIRGSVTHSWNTGGAVAINKPTGVVAGDVLLAFMLAGGGLAQPTITNGSGAAWLPLLDNTRTSLFGPDTVAIWYKIANGAEPANYTMSTSGTSPVVGSIIAYSGVHQTRPIAAQSFNNLWDVGSTSLRVPKSWDHYGNSMAVAFALGAHVNATFTPPAGFTEREDYGWGSNAGMISIAEKLRGAAGAEATGTFTSTASLAYMSGVIMLRDAAATADPTGVARLNGILIDSDTFSTDTQVMVPKCAKVGDLLVLLAHLNSDAIPGGSAPADWTQLFAFGMGEGGASDTISGLWYRVVDGTEPTRYTFSLSNDREWYAAVLHYINTDGGAPDASARTLSAGASTNVVCPSVTTLLDNSLLLNIIAGADLPSLAFAPPGGTNEEAEIGGSADDLWIVSEISAVVGSETRATAGATGTRTWTQSSSVGSVAYSLVLGPSNPAPTAPTLVSPANASTVDAAAGFTVESTFNDPGDTISGIYIRRKIVGAPSYEYYNSATGLWQGTESKIVQVSDDFTFPASKWTNGNNYQWSMAHEDSLNQKGAYASDFTLTASTPPTTTVTGPTGTVVDTTTPSVTWTRTDPEGNTFQAYEVIVEFGAYGATPGAGTEIYDSGQVNSTATTQAVSTPLTNGTTYRAFVRTKAGDQWGPWAFSTFTMGLNVPAEPTLTLTPEPAAGRMRIDVQGRDNLLTTNQASAEVDTTGWAVVAGSFAALTRSTTFALDGSASFLLTKNTATGNMGIQTPAGTAGFPVSAGKVYTAVAASRAGTTARSTRVDIGWYDAAGALLSTSVGIVQTNNNQGWTQSLVSGVAPVGAAYAQVLVYTLAVPSGELHYYDEIGLFPTKPAPAGLQLPSGGSFYASTPDHADFGPGLTLGLDVRWKGSFRDYTPSAQQSFVGHYDTTGNQRSWDWRLNTGGTMTVNLSTDGVNTVGVSSPAVGLTDGATKWFRFTFDAVTQIVRFFLSDDGENWTQLGADSAAVGFSTLFNSTAALTIGAINAGTVFQMAGVVERVIVKNGVDGETVFDADFTDELQGWETGDDAGDTGLDSTGKVVTINGASSLLIGDWTRGGLASLATHRVQRYDEDAEAWVNVRGAEALAHSGAAAQVSTVYDREMPSYKDTRWRALAEANV
jgi:hypothetical protein